MRGLVLLFLLTGCRSPTEVKVSHAFVRRSQPTADTIRVQRADSLRVEIDLYVQSGRAVWELEDPAQQVAWGGSVTEADTSASITVADPNDGDWRLVLSPDSAIGVASMRASTR